MKSGASSSNAVPLDDAASVAMTPALEAETERLLSQRTRDIQFSPEMVRAYRRKDWPQRSKIARAWMVWVALISMTFVPVSYLLAPDFLWLTTIISGLLVPALHACAYLVWRKPRSANVEGLSLVLLMSSVAVSSAVQAALLPSRENPLVASSASMTPSTIDRPPTCTLRVAPRSLMSVRPTRTNRVHANSLGPDAFVVCGPLS